MLVLIFPQHILCKVQYDWSRRQTVRGPHAVRCLCQACFEEGVNYPSLSQIANFNCIASCVLLCFTSWCLTHSYPYPAPSDCYLLAQRSKTMSLSLKMEAKRAGIKPSMKPTTILLSWGKGMSNMVTDV